MAVKALPVVVWDPCTAGPCTSVYSWAAGPTALREFLVDDTAGASAAAATVSPDAMISTRLSGQQQSNGCGA